jgi:asparagine synthase (glutamine-hydrolysing)
MCGICGFVGLHEDGLLERMTETLAHRGPDGLGYFQQGDVGLGHRRLSVIDVAGGRQPLYNEDRSIALVVNGEIYNYRELREQLCGRGHRFRTKSDCEVIVHLYEERGPECLQDLIGMFALALYDVGAQRLLLARDRLGIKPLYFVDLPGRLLFGSECKALLQYRGFEPTLDPAAVHDYLALRYVPGPGGMLREIRKLAAGHYLIVEDSRVTSTCYWRPELYAGPFEGTDDEYLEGFAERFERSIKRRLISEVPLGAYLSGGLDSSVIVAAMSKITSTPVRTFTVGFDYEHDELASAAHTAELLGCEHTEISCRPSDIDLLPQIVYHLDEPIGDPIVIPMFQLAREAKKQVTVVLTGEGADETLGGYLFHKALLRSRRLATVLSRRLRRSLLSPLLAATPAAAFNLAFEYPASLGERGKQKVLDFVDLVDPEQICRAYRHLISLFDERDTVDLYTNDFRRAVDARQPPAGLCEVAASPAPFLNRVLHLQFAHWLPEDILTKQDKMSMAHAIEARVPFLDHELVEYVLRVPPSLKIRGRQTKYLLRRYAARLLPPSIAARRKMPFYMPIERRFGAAAYQELVDDTLSDRAVRSRGLFRPDTVARLRQLMRGGEFMYAKQVFSLVALELWFRMAVDRRMTA